MPDGQVFSLPDVAMKAEDIRANRLTNRINQLRIADAERLGANALKRQKILSGAVTPQGTIDPQAAERGFIKNNLFDEAFDFKKMHDQTTANKLAIEQGVATLKGTKLTNAKKKFNVLGLANLGLTEGYSELIRKGVPRPEAMIKMQPLLNKTNEALKNAGFTEQDLMATFDPEEAATRVNMSKEALDLIGAAETREGAAETRRGTAEERKLKRAEAKVKNKRGARKRLSDIGVAKARLLSRTPVDAEFAKLMGIEGVDVNNVEEVKAALKTLETEAVSLRNEFKINSLDDIFGGK